MSRPIPVSFADMFPAVLGALKYSWRGIVSLAVAVWGVYAILLLLWGIATFNASGNIIQFLQQVSSYEDPWGELASYIQHPTLLFAGFIVFPVLYLVCVSFVSTVTVRLIEEGYFAAGESANMASGVSVLQVIRRSVATLPRMMLVYFIMFSCFIILVGGFVFLSIISGIWVSEWIPPMLILAYFVLVPIMAAGVGVGGWFLLYIKWGVFAGQAAVLNKRNPFTVSAELSWGRRWNLAWRVLAVTAIAVVVGGMLSTVFTIFEFAGVLFFFVAVAVRILVSVLSSASVVAFFTPLYIKLDEELSS